MKPSPFHFHRELVLLALRQGSYPLSVTKDSIADYLLKTAGFYISKVYFADNHLSKMRKNRKRSATSADPISQGLLLCFLDIIISTIWIIPFNLKENL